MNKEGFSVRNVPLPAESDAQRIGHNAGKAFIANSPNSWRAHSLEGTDDAGFDYQVQVVRDGRYSDIFRVQLKGTESPELNATKEFFSITLKGRTLNYYSRVTEPILLVLCDLSVDPERPAACPLYYVWIHDEIRRHREINPESEQQTSLAIRVPSANLLTSSFDISPEIDGHRRRYEAALILDQAVEAKLPAIGQEGRTEILRNLSGGLSQRSSALIEVLSSPVTSPWPEAPPHTFAGRLTEIAKKLSAGLSRVAKEMLESLGLEVSQATIIEQAEYRYLLGKQLSQDLDESSALGAFKTAYDLSSSTSKYKVAWIEAELRWRFSDEGIVDYSDLKIHLSGVIVEEVNLHARLLAAEGKYEDADMVLSEINQKDTLSARVIIASMQSHWSRVISLCSEGLALINVKDETTQLFYLLRARAYFNSAVFGDAIPDCETRLPTFGPSRIDFELLNLAWSDIQKTTQIMSVAGWAINVEYIADIWSSTSLILGREKDALMVLKSAASARPKARSVNNALEQVAMRCNEWDIALHANSMQPVTAERQFHRIVLLHQARKYPECVRLIVEEYDSLPRDHELFPSCAAIGALTAHVMVHTELVEKIEAELRGIPEWSDHVAVLDYFKVLSSNALARDSAISSLEAAYRSTGNSKMIGIQLFYALDAFNEKEARSCVDIANNLADDQQLPMEGEFHLAQAYTTLGDWKSLLVLVDNAIKRFCHVVRFQAIRALALDKLGDTPQALQQLKLIVENDSDQVAVNTYISIATRCGFTDEAIALVERLLGQELNRVKKIDYLRMLFGLVHTSNPQSQRAEQIAWQIGQHTNRNVEEEEGPFILTYLTATLSAQVSVAEVRRTEFQARIKGFTEKFPESKMFRVGQVPENSNSEELVKILKNLVGNDESRETFQRKLENQLEKGTVAIPFAWRPSHVLRNVRDTVELWQIAKKSKREARQYHLSMVFSDWSAVPLDKVKGNIPLLDLVTLLVLKDLNLFPVVFNIFPKIAISQNTLVELRNLSIPMAGSWARTQCQELIDLLKSNFEKIIQPVAPFMTGGNDSLDGKAVNDGIKMLVEKSDYLLYSDDALFRIYASGEQMTPSICTLDVLYIAEDLGHLSPKEVAKAVGRLCIWNVGVVISERYLLSAIPDEVGSSNSVQEAVQVICDDEISHSLFSAAWNVSKKHEVIYEHATVILTNLFSEIDNSIQTITAVLAVWHSKFRLRTDVGNTSPVVRLAHFVAGVLAKLGKTEYEYTSRVIKVYLDVVAWEYGDRMDEDKEREAIRTLAIVGANVDHGIGSKSDNRIRRIMLSGFVDGTADSDCFSLAYTNRFIEIGLQEPN